MALFMLPTCIVFFRGLAAAPRAPGWGLKSIALAMG